MAKRLVKIATELNVGTERIVEFLTSQGFDIVDRPTAKVTEEMHDALKQEFFKDSDVRKQADEVVIGDRKSKEDTPTSKSAVEKTPPPDPKPAEVLKPAEDPAAKQKTEPEQTPKTKLTGPKVLGKVDLEPKKRPTTKKSETPDPEPSKPAETQDIPTEDTAPQEQSKPEITEEQEFRAETPTLKGLKVLGKVDASKFESKEKKKPTEKTSSPTEQKKRRRRRKRQKVTANGAAGSRSKPKEIVKEISQKEIDEKIKATMARLTGRAGKKQRQKLKRQNRERHREKRELEEIEAMDQTIQLTEFVSVSELASLLNIEVADVITTCMNLGVIVSINQRLDAEIIELLASEFERDIKFISAEDDTAFEEEIEDAEEDLEPRPPIVTVMGHVDHGKTSLLDYIRKSTVAEGEAGGITQHIGAYEIFVGEEQKGITFLDTPGHEAFTAMRARGAKLTDIAIIIVAADDGLMPQTKEAISHAQAAGVPMIFAINKIDKPGADPERVKQELASINLMVEDWGGKYQSQDISAKTGQNIDLLLEKIILEAEMLELKANPNRPAMGTVIEAALDRGRGYVCKMLVQTGTLKQGDVVVAGEHWGKVKAMFDENDKKIKEAEPSKPVLILGLGGAPQAGEVFKVLDSEQEARQISQRRAQINREQSNRASKRISLDEIGRRIALGTFKELNLIVKGDVDGSIEALSDALIKLSVETIQVNVLSKAVGQITESDVLLASASDAIIIGFQVRPSVAARNLAEREGVQIKTYSVIYEAIEEVKSAMEGMLEPKEEEKITAQIEIREVYKISKVGTIGGAYVLEGKVSKTDKIRLIREGIVIYPNKENQIGELASLKRFKEDVKEVKSGFECGIRIKNYNDIKVGDIIEAYEIVQIRQTLD